MTDKILIVDDELESLKMLGLMLQRKGYDIVAANSGAQALEQAAEGQPDLIILDAMMPEMDGFEALRRLRSNSITKHIPTIMFTAKIEIEDKLVGFEAGADDYVTKPADPKELDFRIKALLRRSAKQQIAVSDKPGKLISFIGVKGGVGTTTAAVNTAVAIAQHADGDSVGLAEMRPGQGYLSMMLGYRRSHALGNLIDKYDDELTVHAIQNELILDHSGINLLMAATSHDSLETNYSLEAAESLALKLTETLDFTILDLGSGLSQINNQLAAISNQVVIFLEPQEIAVAQAKQMLQDLNELGVGSRRIQVVLTNHAQAAVQLSWQSVQEGLEDKALLAIISPASTLAYQALAERVPLILLQPESIPSGQFRKLATDLMVLLGDNIQDGE